MSNTPEYLIYFEMPLYLAQWFANHCHEDDYVPPKNDDEIHFYEFDKNNPVGVKIKKGSPESYCLSTHIQRQPSAAPEQIPDETTIAIILPWYKNKDKRTYNYLNKTAKKAFIDCIREQCYWQVYEYVMKNKRINPKQKLKTTLEMFCREREMNWLQDSVEFAVKQAWTRMYRNIWARNKTAKKKKDKEEKKK